MIVNIRKNNENIGSFTVKDPHHLYMSTHIEVNNEKFLLEDLIPQVDTTMRGIPESSLVVIVK